MSPWFTIYDAPAPEEKDGILYFKRGRSATDAPAENTIRIICLGDSATVNTPTKTHYPGILQDKLNKIYKSVKFEVLNAGGDAFSSAHSFVNFALRLLYYSPNCVIVYHNITDLSANYFLPFVKTDYANKYLNNLFLTPECKLGLQKFLFHSRLLSYFIIRWNSFLFEKKAVSFKQPIDITQGKQIFKTNLDNIINIAKANNIKIILGTQAACFKHAKPFPYIKKEDFCVYNDVIRRVAQDQGVILVDCFEALEEDPRYFTDLIHYTEEGIEKLSDTFHQQIKKLYPE